MPNQSLKKTKSAPDNYEENQLSSIGLERNRIPFVGLRLSELKRHKTWLIATGLIFLGLLALISPSLFYEPATATLKVGSQMRYLEIATSETAQKQGLGYRDSLPEDHGMLFVFDKPSSDCFWMKGMRFPLDMVWLDSQKKVTKVASDVPVDSYPETQYCPDQPTKYVIELNAGQVKALNLTVGRSVSL